MENDDLNSNPLAGFRQFGARFVIGVESGQAALGAGNQVKLGEPQESTQSRQQCWPVAAIGGGGGSVERLRSALGALRRFSFHTRTQFCPAERLNARRPSTRDGLVANGVNVGGAHALPEDSPFPMPARLADGLGLESGPGDLTVRPGPVLRTLGSPLAASGRGRDSAAGRMNLTIAATCQIAGGHLRRPSELFLAGSEESSRYTPPARQD